jgi:hypothetical protein
VNISYGLAFATLLVAFGAGPALANEPAAPAANAYRESPTPIDCRRAPGRALSLLRESGMNPCNRDGVPAVAPRSASPASAASTAARTAQSGVTAAPPEAQSATPRVDRAECPTQTAGQPEKRPRHLLFLHLT